MIILLSPCTVSSNCAFVLESSHRSPIEAKVHQRASRQGRRRLQAALDGVLAHSAQWIPTEGARNCARPRRQPCQQLALDAHRTEDRDGAAPHLHAVGLARSARPQQELRGDARGGEQSRQDHVSVHLDDICLLPKTKMFLFCLHTQ